VNWPAQQVLFVKLLQMMGIEAKALHAAMSYSGRWASIQEFQHGPVSWLLADMRSIRPAQANLIKSLRNE
ncbi:MAG: hypothetical protein Q9218_007165, partial [Villophora microphyllina]